MDPATAYPPFLLCPLLVYRPMTRTRCRGAAFHVPSFDVLGTWRRVLEVSNLESLMTRAGGLTLYGLIA